MFDKKAISEAKDKAYKNSTKEGVNEIFKLAKARHRRRQDISSVRYMRRAFALGWAHLFKTGINAN